MADEAHRSQYGFVEGGARWMREALPNATFVGFTGTPLERDDKNTIHVFGEYADVYDIRQAVEDGATKPLYYESRIVKLTVDEAGAARRRGRARAASPRPTATARAGRSGSACRWKRWSVRRSVSSALAAFIVEHWEKRRAAMEGKAMVVTMSRDIAARLYEAIRALRPDWHDADDERGAMKVVVTGTGRRPGAAAQPRAHARPRASAWPSASRTRRRPAAGDRLRHVADRLRLPAGAHDVSGQAAGRAQPDAGHRAREPRLRRKARRADRGPAGAGRPAGRRTGHLHPGRRHGRGRQEGAGRGRARDAWRRSRSCGLSSTAATTSGRSTPRRRTCCRCTCDADRPRVRAERRLETLADAGQGTVGGLRAGGAAPGDRSDHAAPGLLPARAWR